MAYRHSLLSDCYRKGRHDAAMAARIGPKRPRRIFLKEWREHRDLTQERLGERLGVSDVTVHRWEKNLSLLNTNVMAAIAEALMIEPTDLYRHPDQPSADQLLRGASPEVMADVLSYIEFAKNRRAS